MLAVVVQWLAGFPSFIARVRAVASARSRAAGGL